MTKKDSDEHTSRRLLTVLIVVAITILSIFCMQLVRVFRRLTIRVSPRPVTTVAPSGQQIVATDCYTFLLLSTYELERRPNCEVNAYARPEKYRYVNVAPYYESSESEILQRWQARWLTLGAQEESREQVDLDGKRAWRLIERYPQNGERFVSYIVILPRPMPVDSQDRITAFEIRGWATTPADEQFLRDVVGTWRWRV